MRKGTVRKPFIWMPPQPHYKYTNYFLISHPSDIILSRYLLL